MCRCDKDYWKNIHKGLWTSTMSPYEERYVDVKFAGGISGSVAVTVEEGMFLDMFLILIS